jgi:hypothetical protein
MDSTVTIDAAQLEGLASRLTELESGLTEDDKVALLAVFALAGEALDARIEDEIDVSGFAIDSYHVGLQVGVPSTLPGLGGGLLGSIGGGGGAMARKAGEKPQEYLKVTMQQVLISG